MKMLAELFTNLPDGKVVDVRIGLHWTAVVVEVAGIRQCGLASTLFEGHTHNSQPAVPEAGKLERFSGKELANWLFSESPTQRSLGMAALNALLPPPTQELKEVNAEEAIARLGAGKTVALVGHFPFVDRLRQQVGELHVLELDPGPGDIPASAAPEIIPLAEVVAITGMTVINHTLPGLLELCPPQAYVMVLGPSTPLHPALFEHGIDLLSGAIVKEIEPVLKAVSQGGSFRQVHKAGVHLVTIQKEV
jgi:hypothetical protein